VKGPGLARTEHTEPVAAYQVSHAASSSCTWRRASVLNNNLLRQTYELLGCHKPLCL